MWPKIGVEGIEGILSAFFCYLFLLISLLVGLLVISVSLTGLSGFFLPGSAWEKLQKIWSWIRRHQAGFIFLWNSPLIGAGLCYFDAISKLMIMGYTNSVFALWNARTQQAIRVTVWIRHNLWVFFVYGLLINLLYLVIPRRKSMILLRAIACILLWIPALWYGDFGFYLSNKLIMPR